MLRVNHFYKPKVVSLSKTEINQNEFSQNKYSVQELKEASNHKFSPSILNENEIQIKPSTSLEKKKASPQTNLDFEPESQWPDILPRFSFKGELLCGFQKKHLSCQIIPLDEANSLHYYIKSLYPQLSFMELARLTKKLQNLPQNSSLLKSSMESLSGINCNENINSYQLDSNQNSSVRFEIISQLWSLYQFRNYEQHFELIDKIISLPKDLQTWIHQKKVSPLDLAPFKALSKKESFDLLEPLWQPFLYYSFSKSDGVKVIEYLIELLLLEFPLQELFPPNWTENSTLVPTAHNSGENWMHHLHSLRYPKSTQFDQNAEALLLQQTWPKKMDARWIRRGDRSGVELKLFFTHPDELKQNIVGLEKTLHDIKNKPELDHLWIKKT